MERRRSRSRERSRGRNRSRSREGERSRSRVRSRSSEETRSRGRKRSRERSRSSERNRSVQGDDRIPWDSDSDQIKTKPDIEDLTDENCNHIEPEEKVFEKVNTKLNEVLGLMFVSPPTDSNVIDESRVLRKIKIIKSKINVNNVSHALKP